MNADSHGTSEARWRPLKALLGGHIDVPESLEVSDLTQDSREVRPGAAFLAVNGLHHHGIEFAPAAVAAGARVVLWEPVPGLAPPSLDDAVVVAVPQLGAQMGFIADRFFGAPSAALSIAGITGTNGKTTCAWLLAQALHWCGRDAAYLGTLGAGAPGATVAGTHTTPDAIGLQRVLAQFRAQHFGAVAMEVSSHALDQHRCAGVRFHTAVFTNLTRDHLDYHGDMQRYAAAKSRLFEWSTLAVRVINIDDDLGAELAGPSYEGQVVLTSQRPSEALFARPVKYVCATAVTATSDGLAITLNTSWGPAHLASGLIGRFNVDNLLGVLGVLLAWDVPLIEACAALARCEAPPGRMQVSGGGALPLVIVDYAHTPDALDKALAAARAHCVGRLWCVFGCGGERDAGKRSQMGGVAATRADEIILTDDNPRGEDPKLIVTAILTGMPSQEHVTVIHDRATAIRRAVAAAGAGDAVLIAGKGHETYQLVGDERLAFDDSAVVRTELAARSATGDASGARGAPSAGSHA